MIDDVAPSQSDGLTPVQARTDVDVHMAGISAGLCRR
jgi:hypothetical protein